MNIKVINKSSNPLPSYATPASAGMDICAHFPEGESDTINPGQRTLVHTGLYLELPEGFEAQIRPRSGLALKQGLTVLNTPGTIDADYRGEVCVILINHGQEPFVIKQGDRIAQMVIAPITQAQFTEVSTLSSTERGDGGFGHTGK